MTKLKPASPTLAKDGDGGVPASSGSTMTGSDLDAGGRAATPQGVTPLERRRYHSIEVVIDRPVGTTQKGINSEGQEWSRTYTAPYGYIENTQGGDGEPLDVFLGPDETVHEAHWATQMKADKSFDEYKLFLGYPSKAAATKAYTDHIPSKYLHSMATTSVSMVKALLGLAPDEVMKQLAARHAAREVGRAIDSAVLAAQLGAPPTRQPAALPWIAVGKAAEQRFVIGPILIPDTTDGQGDTITADVIERAAWAWLAEFRNTGVQHKMLANDLIKPVESYIVREDTTMNGRPIKAGTWVLGAVIKDDQLWEGVKNGTFTGWSIGGLAQKAPNTP